MRIQKSQTGRHRFSFLTTMFSTPPPPPLEKTKTSIFVPRHHFLYYRTPEY
jgi:hypothetical protein